ncbi:MAG: HEPN domain-containing protein [Candidatus Brockarchaeota archaeon]|nr:HEPN domain-containing protein [Candidatus Brockarchaeota archaeon]
MPECKNLADLLEEKRTQLGLLEDAYIASRYLVKEYAKEDAEILVNIAKEVLELGGLF